MEGHVRVPHPADVVHRHAVPKGVRKAGELPDGGVVRVVGAEVRRLALNGVAHLIEADHVGETQLQHKASRLFRPVHHEAALREARDGLGHRRARDAENGSNLIDIQPGTRGQLQTDDFVIQKPHHQVLEFGLRLRLDHFLQLIVIHLLSPPFLHSTAFRKPPQDEIPQEFINWSFISAMGNDIIIIR